MIFTTRTSSGEDAWEAIGPTRFNRAPHLLCEGTLLRILTILISVYGHLGHVKIARGR